MGDDAIVFRSVNAPAGHQQSSIRDFPATSPLRIRLVDNDEPDIRRTGAKGLLQKDSLADWIARDVAADIAGLLGSAGRISAANQPAPPLDDDWRPVAPADIGVLTKTNKGRSQYAMRSGLPECPR